MIVKKTTISRRNTSRTKDKEMGIVFEDFVEEKKVSYSLFGITFFKTSKDLEITSNECKYELFTQSNKVGF